MSPSLTLACSALLSGLAVGQELTPGRIIDPPGYGVLDPLVSSTGDTIVFEAQANGLYDLFVLHVDDDCATRVTGPLLPSATSLTVTLAPGDGHVLYTSGGDWYVFPTDLATAPVRLTGPHAVSPSLLQLSSNGTLAVYAAEDPPGVPALFSVPVDGSAAPLKLTGAFAAGLGVRSIRLGPDGATAVYVADQDVPFEYELYRVPTDASAPPVQVHPPLVAGGDVQASSGLNVSPDGSRVTYIADQDTDDLSELYSAPLDGSSPVVKLSSTFSGLASSAIDAWISPDSAYAVYTQSSGGPTFTRGLFSVPLAGGTIHGHTAYVDRLDNVEISPDSQRVVWQDGRERSNGLDIDFELESNDIYGNLSSSIVLETFSFFWPGSFGGWFGGISEDSQRFVYSEIDGFSLGNDVRSVELSGGLPLLLYTGSREVWSMSRPIGDYVHYSIEFEDLFRARIDGSQPPQPVDLLGQNSVLPAVVSSNGRCMVYSDTVNHWARWVAVELDALAPARGPGTGGTVVNLRGTGFSPDTEVLFGNRPAAAVQFVDETLLLATTPPSRRAAPHPPRVARIVDVTVGDVGTQAVQALAFRYVP